MVPVGTIAGANGKEVDWLDKKLKGTTYIGHMNAPDMERILSLDPDLILGVEKHHAKAYDALSKMASTVFIENMEDDWRNIYRYVAHVTSKEKLAEDRLKEFDAKLAKAKSELAGKLNGETVLFMRVHHKESRLFGVNSHLGKIAYEGLGLSYPKTTPLQEAEMPVSFESIPEFNPDHLFLLDTLKQDNVKVLEDMKQNPLWKNSKAVQKGNVYMLGDLNDSKAGKGLVLYNLFADEVIRSLKGKP